MKDIFKVLVCFCILCCTVQVRALDLLFKNNGRADDLVIEFNEAKLGSTKPLRPGQAYSVPDELVTVNLGKTIQPKVFAKLGEKMISVDCPSIELDAQAIAYRYLAYVDKDGQSKRCKILLVL